MSGWKTKAAAFVSVLYGLVGWWAGLHGADGAMQFIVAGMTTLGVGHKIEKAGAAYAQAQSSSAADLVRRNSQP